MRARQFIVEGAEENANVVEMFQKFLPLAMEILEIDSLPKMRFAPDLNTGEQPSFGAYVPGENMLLVALKNRHPVDILRTVAHELVHFYLPVWRRWSSRTGAGRRRSGRCDCAD